MIITINGTPGSGKTTIAKYLAEKFKLKLYNVGEMVREIAEKKGLSLLELDKEALKDKRIDKEIDKIHKKLKGKDNFVLDSRVGFYFFPKSIKIFLYCDEKIAAQRIFRQKRDVERYKSVRDVLKEIRERRKIDFLRYKKNYGIDILNKKNYDIIIDTTNLSVRDANKVVEKIIKRLA